MRKVVVVGLVLLAVAGSACGSKDPSPGGVWSGAASCESLFGLPTDEALGLLNAGPCTDGGGDMVVSLIASYECEDGSEVVWTDSGIGHSGGVWAPSVGEFSFDEIFALCAGEGG